jgi:hypothetical protein
MGLFGFFRRRRERESALPPGHETSADPAVVGSTAGGGEPVTGAADPSAAQIQVSNVEMTSSIEIDDLSDLAQIGGLIQKAIQEGNVELTQSGNQVIDLRGSGLRERIVEAMREHGVNTEAGSGETISADSVPGLQEAIMQALAEHGVDLDQLGQGQSAGDSRFGSGDPDAGSFGDPGSDSGGEAGGDAGGSPD